MQQPGSNKAVKKGCACGVGGCTALVIGIAGFVGVIIYLTAFSNTCAKMMGEETYPIAGDAARFDPFAAIPDIKSKLGAEAILLEMNASSVRSDGTLDLKAQYKPAPSADYRFRIPIKEAPKDAPPIGAGRKPGDVWVQDVTVRVYEPGMRRHVSRISGGTRSSYSYTNEGMDMDRSSPQMGTLEESLPEPKISPKQMWDFAISKGADKDAVARITFDDDGYEFTISELRYHLRWDKDGKFEEGRSTWPEKVR
jgi:hypothetical protein